MSKPLLTFWQHSGVLTECGAIVHEIEKKAARKSEPKPALKAYAVVWAALVVVGLIAFVPLALRWIDQFYYGGMA